MRTFGDCVLLTRVGSFYELYFEHAEKFGPLLNLKVATKKTTAGRVPMAGFPLGQLERALQVLVRDCGYHVAISEEIENTASRKVKSGGLMFDRRVSRIVTPGTLIDEQFVNPSENNFLLAAHLNTAASRSVTGQAAADTATNLDPPCIGLAWLDLTTGDFSTQQSSPLLLSAVVARLDPREIVLTSDAGTALLQDTLSKLQGTRHIVVHPMPPVQNTLQSSWSSVLDKFDLTAYESHSTTEEIRAGACLLDYVGSQLQGLKIKLQSPTQRQGTETMSIDQNSMRALEIKSTLKNGTSKGSLLHSIRRTVTHSGTRLLTDWLTAPSTSIKVIDGRLDLVACFLADPELQESIVHVLRDTFDSQRIVQKFSLGRGTVDDLVQLCKTIEAVQKIVATLTEDLERPASSIDTKTPGESSSIRPACLKDLLRRFELQRPHQLARQIAEAIDEEQMVRLQRLEDEATVAFDVNEANAVEGDSLSMGDKSQAHQRKSNEVAKASVGDALGADMEEIWLMRKSASLALNGLHDALGDLWRERAELEERLRQSHGAPSLTLRWTPGLGHICHVRGKDSHAPSASLRQARSVRASKSTRSFYLPEWTQLGGKLDAMKQRIRAEEQRIFQILRQEVVTNIPALRRNAAVLDELDIACSSASLAAQQRLVRPNLNLGTRHRIFGGRHPTVETGLEEQGRSFVKNDCLVGDEELIWLITGPNMAGKSTFLRQNALISILAQAGCFVPADYAEIGIVDRIFSRVGSADNVYRDESTFMVEMLETAAILKQATPRSFVIMDEVGRGTTPQDGIAMAYACLHHLYYTNRCRTLFATHFHDLAEMTGSLERIGRYCTDVSEHGDGSFSYVHRLRRGVNRESHALKVAGLAGIPKRALDEARHILEATRRGSDAH
ncbi:MAG: DNA mismatch repair ATPase msh1 [Caeruleum heppii]|nr:MAG: DNA mismatch repair ATPase msh1 [Caeruleum heppii]